MNIMCVAYCNIHLLNRRKKKGYRKQKFLDSNNQNPVVFCEAAAGYFTSCFKSMRLSSVTVSPAVMPVRSKYPWGTSSA